MPQPPKKLPKAVWFYVGILTLVVIVFWSFFWKREFKAPINKGENRSFSQILKEFTSSVSQGGEVINQIVNQVKDGDRASVPPELIDQLSGKVAKQLWQQRIAGWQEWTNEDLSFKLPATWQLSQEEELIIITSFDRAISLIPSSRAAIELSFLSNLNNLSPNDWWSNEFADSLDQFVTLEATEAIGSISGLKKVVEGNSNSLANYSEYIILPLEDQLVQIVIDIFGQSGQFETTIADFKKTIEFK